MEKPLYSLTRSILTGVSYRMKKRDSSPRSVLAPITNDFVHLSTCKKSITLSVFISLYAKQKLCFFFVRFYDGIHCLTRQFTHNINFAPISLFLSTPHLFSIAKVFAPQQQFSYSKNLSTAKILILEQLSPSKHFQS
jgi:hypothetical protein